MKKRFTENELSMLENHGYTHVYSVVKSIRNTTYVNCRSISAIRANGGKWIPAERYSITWRGPVGITIPTMYARYGNDNCAGYRTVRYDLPNWISESK